MSAVLLSILPQSVDGVNPPEFSFIAATGKWHALFDDTTDEILYWTFRVPPDYSSAPVMKLPFCMTSAVTGTLGLRVEVMSVSPGDAASIKTASFDTANTGSATVPATTAGRLGEISINLTNNDSMAAGDQAIIKVSRNTSVGGNAVGDAELLDSTMEYTPS